MGLVPEILRALYPLQSGVGTIANSKIFRQLDGNPAGDVLAKSGRFSLVVPQDDYVGRSIKYFGDLDKKVTWVVRQVLQPGDTALDIGANLGLVSFRMLEQVGAAGRVIAFEPQSRMVSYIEKSISHNRVDNLHVHNIGLADRPGTLRLSVPDDNAGAASFVSNKGSNVEEVPVTTLDEFTRTHGLEDVRLLKVDVEGFESQVFSGGKDFLSRVKPDVILFEENRNTGDIPDSIAILQSSGYEIFSLPKAWFSVFLQPYEKGAVAHDFVAIHKDAPATLRRRLGV